MCVCACCVTGGADFSKRHSDDVCGAGWVGTWVCTGWSGCVCVSEGVCVYVNILGCVCEGVARWKCVFMSW